MAGRKPKFRTADIEEALRRSAGVISLAARGLGCSRRTILTYISRHPRLRQVLDETLDANLDMAESQLIKAIKDGNMTSVIFYLKTKGKHRGYVQRIEAGGIDGRPVELRVKHSGRVKIDPIEAYRRLLEE